MDELIDELETPAPAVETRAPAPGPPAPRAPAPASAEVLPPLPRAIVLAREMETLEAEIDRMREKPGVTGEQMRPYWARHKQLKDLIDGAGPAGEEGPKLSDDPREAAAGMLSPEEPDAQAFERRIDMSGTPLTDEGKMFRAEIEMFVPRVMHAEAESMMRDVDAMAADAAANPWTHDRAIVALDPSDVVFFRLGFDRLSSQARAAIDSREQRFHPPTIRRIARSMEHYYRETARGRREWEQGGRTVFDDMVRTATEDRRSWQGDDE